MASDEQDPVGTLRGVRTSIKWTRYAPDVLPLFVAEMDHEVAPEIRQALVERVQQSDLGYLDGPGPLAPAFAAFARDRWGWDVDPARVYLATDVSVGIVETLRLALPDGGRVAITPPVYPPFFELVEEARCQVEEVPLLERWGVYRLDLDGLERAFADGVRVFLLCNPHNPIGLVHDRADLVALAELAARYDVLVISDEIHAPLTHPGVQFTPFASIAEPLGARSVCVTSASKGWNLAGVKCSVIVAGDTRTTELLDTLWEEVACRTSILGLHANVAAFSLAVGWLDDVVDRIVANDRLLAKLLAEHLPGVVYARPRAGYLAWLDFRGARPRRRPGGAAPGARVRGAQLRLAVRGAGGGGSPGSTWRARRRPCARRCSASLPRTRRARRRVSSGTSPDGDCGRPPLLPRSATRVGRPQMTVPDLGAVLRSGIVLLCFSTRNRPPGHHERPMPLDELVQLELDTYREACGPHPRPPPASAATGRRVRAPPARRAPRRVPVRQRTHRGPATPGNPGDAGARDHPCVRRRGGRPMTTKHTVRAQRDGRSWLVWIDDELRTQARRQRDVELMARDWLANMHDRDADSFTLDVEFVLPDSVRAHLDRAVELRAEADRARRAATNETAAAARELHEAGLTLREIGPLLDVSYQRAQQLVAAAE
ncbi:aminotransferase class I/II-fold pyridoxal phosphate-dependent enzyme [Curtobacterium sp. MCJR17_043]|uniref:aminotransferase class I/II-fold pyridoxal phosphate-dependent enzyme n=2 Tax=Curtobacterium TaxID=2034 RepID=UPI0032E8C140